MDNFTFTSDFINKPEVENEWLEIFLRIWEVESSWNVMAHGDAREGEWRGNWRMEWVASNLHTTSERFVSSITTADAHTSAASSRLNWRPCPFKWTRPFRRKTKSGFCACAITFQTQSNGFLCRPKTFYPERHCVVFSFHPANATIAHQTEPSTLLYNLLPIHCFLITISLNIVPLKTPS